MENRLIPSTLVRYSGFVCVMLTIIYIKLSVKIFSPLSSLNFKVKNRILNSWVKEIKVIGYFLNNENEIT